MNQTFGIESKQSINSDTNIGLYDEVLKCL